MDATRTAAAMLALRYDEPWRRYHDRTHVEEMLTALRTLTGEPLHPALELAAWAHDAVYDAHAPAGTSERARAELARAVLTDVGVAAEILDEVVDLTLATITHEVPEGLSAERRERAAAFLDADLWIFAAPPERFDAYDRAIREEYSFVPDEMFAEGRAAVLADFAGRERVYLTERGRLLWEDSARNNLARIGHHGNAPQHSSS